MGARWLGAAVAGVSLASVAACAPLTGSPSPVPSTEPSPTLAAAGGPGFRTWTRIDLPDPAPDAYGGGTPSAVAAFDGGFVAVGAVTSCCDGLHLDLARGVLWTSDDGRTWTLRDGIATFDHAVLRDVTSDGSRLVVTGDVAASATDDEQVAPATWVSLDGVTWLRSAEPAPSHVVASAEGLLGAVATYGTEFASGTVRFVTSGDGLSWANVSGAYSGALRSLVAAPDGSAMALGIVPGPVLADGSAFSDVVAWRSTDGSVWTGAEVIGPRAMPVSLAHDGRGFVALATVSTLLANGSVQVEDHLWRFGADGRPVATRMPVVEGETIASLYVIGDVLLASGTNRVDEHPEAFMLMSADGGATWARVALPEPGEGRDQELADIVETADGLLAVASRSEGTHRFPTAWFSDR